jgi:hypothetical protein
MLDYQTLLAANFSELDQAITKWARLPEEFKKVSTQYRNTVNKGLWASDWEGETAIAACEKLDFVEKQMDAAGGEASDVYRLLSDAHEIFTQAQSKLKLLRADIEKDKYLSIKVDGEVYFDPPEETPTEHLASLNKGYQESIQAYRTSIRNQVTAAQEADDVLAWALSQDYNGRNKGFDAGGFGTVADAKRGMEQADRDLSELTKLAERRGDMTDAELARMNDLLRKHEGDARFTEGFAVKVGPKGTLELWQSLAEAQNDPEREPSKKRLGELAELQQNLGVTIASATQSDSGAMKDWKTAMVDLGDQRIGSGRPHDAFDSPPLGFQVMSSLMRNGEYDTQFLGDYGKELLKFEQDAKARTRMTPAELWHPLGDFTALNVGLSDHGMDPMAGYMEALGRNPEAAKDLFCSSKSGELDPDLQYLMEDRKWPLDSTSLKQKDEGYGYAELGHALEAATLGVPYDSTEAVIHRDGRTANVMTQVAEIVGSDIEYVGDRPGVGDSLARMGAGYMDDLNWSTINEGGRGDSMGRDELYRHTGDGHISLTQATARNFLYNVGQHEGSYEVLSSAQHAMTMGALEANPGDHGNAEKILNSGGYVHGLLDEARISALDKEFGDKEDKINQKLAEAAEWKKFGASQGLGLAAGIAVLPLGGPGASAAAMFVVPTLVEGAAGAVETQWGIEIDRETKEQEKDLSNESRMSESRFAELGQLRANSPALLYQQQHHPGQDYTEGVLNAYDRGANSTDRTDGGRR